MEKSVRSWIVFNQTVLQPVRAETFDLMRLFSFDVSLSKRQLRGQSGNLQLHVGINRLVLWRRNI